MVGVTLIYIFSPISTIGTSWFLIQMMVVSFLTYRRFILINFALILITLATVTYIHPHTISIVQTFLAFIPILVAFIFLQFYEYRNNAIVQLLNAKNEELAQYNKQLEKIDLLTGLLNKNAFLSELDGYIRSAAKHIKQFTLIHIDIDHFKQINDSLGHTVGDAILVEASKKLVQHNIENNLIVSRFNADEFMLLVKDDATTNTTLKLQKLLELLSETYTIDEQCYTLTASIGVASYPQDGKSSQDLLKSVESAMFLAKERGRNRFEFYNKQLTEIAHERLSIVDGLRKAIASKQFIVVYQPQIDSLNNRIIGMEALVRWKHPVLGIISPVKFIPIAEEYGLITEIDFIVMKEAMQSFIQWKKDGLNPVKLSLNLSIRCFEEIDYVTRLQKLMDQLGFDPKELELELTEGSIMKDSAGSIERLNQMRELGIEISVDDFGTGYSSLAYLQKLPISKLKIDRSFVLDIMQNQESASIVLTIINLTKSLNLNVIAEGVEIKEQQEFLANYECSNIQGYLYSKPLENRAMKQFLQHF